MPEMTIEGWHDAISTGHQTLLDAALAAGVPVPHQCRAGECGTCKCRLLRGEVERRSNLPAALSAEERAEDWILSCRTVARSNVSVAFAEPLRAPVPPQQKCQGHVKFCETVSRDVVRLVLQLNRPLEFFAGQYVALRFPGYPERSFSPANTPGSRFLEFYVRVLPDGVVSQHISRHVSPGDRADIVGPFGQAYQSDCPQGPLLLAGGGTGLAPMLSILRHVAARAPRVPVTLYVGFRTTADLFAGEPLRALSARLPALQVITVLSDEATDEYRVGFVAPVILEDQADLSRHQIFIAGPPPLVDSVRDAAIERGAKPQSIYADPFLATSDANETSRPSRFGRWLKFGIG